MNITTEGDWGKQVGTNLKRALQASIQIVGRTGEEACRHAMILMAQSAAALTKASKKTRVVLKDVRLNGADYVEVYKQGKADPTRMHKWRFSATARAEDRWPGTWENCKKIGNSGLSKRSWKWGLSKIGGKEGSKAISGASKFYSILGPSVCGYIKENRMSVLVKILPFGWESQVENAVSNKIMKQAELKLKRKWVSEMSIGRWPDASPKKISDYFVKGVTT